MSTMSYMFSAYLVIWGLSFILIFSMWASSRRLEKELETVKILVQDLEKEQNR